MKQTKIDKNNSRFWNEICGLYFAKHLGIKAVNPNNIDKFDAAYTKKFPYLNSFIPKNLKNKKILEIGIGYGTIGQALAKKNNKYFSMDIALQPLKLMQKRLEWIKYHLLTNAVQASALNIPFKSSSFDYIYSIGCLHHTGNLSRAINEVYRVLKPQGTAIIMLYNRNSIKYLAANLNFLRKSRNFKVKSRKEFVRAFYDSNAKGEAAPFTEFITKAQARKIFSKFSKISIEIHKINPLPMQIFDGLFTIPKNQITQKLVKAFGADLYISAIK